MPVERETIVERPVERETVVTGDSGNPLGPIIGIVAAVLIVVLLFWFFGGMFSSGGDGGAVNVDLPNVTVTE